MPDNDDFLPKSALKGLGWTDGSVKKHLGEPDKLKSNPRYKSGAPMQLFSRRRVLLAMETEAWQEWHSKSLAKRKRQSQAQRTIAEAKRNQLISKALSDLVVEPPRYKGKKAALKAAIESWHAAKLAHNDERDVVDWVDKPTIEGTDEATLQRWAENMFRHDHSNYDEILWTLTGQIGHAPAYAALKDEVRRRYNEWLETL